MRLLSALGFKVIATSGTQRFLADNGVPAEKINKVLEGRPHIVDAITNGEVQLVFNTTEGPQALADSRSLRRAALLHKVPYYTTLSGAVAAARASGPISAAISRSEPCRATFPKLRAAALDGISGDNSDYGGTAGRALFSFGTRPAECRARSESEGFVRPNDVAAGLKDDEMVEKIPMTPEATPRWKPN